MEGFWQDGDGQRHLEAMAGWFIHKLGPFDPHDLDLHVQVSAVFPPLYTMHIH